MKRATIKEVAEAAGVSRAAVSKVLRNAYGLSDDMRTRVEAAMAALNYRPQTAARGLRGRTYTLGIVLPDLRNPFFPDILDGVISTLRSTNYEPLIGFRPSAEATERHAIETMLDRKIDGFLMVAPLLEESYLTTVATSVPTVMIGRHDRDCGYDTVNNDDRDGARLAVEHLISLGHRSIAYFGLEPASAAPNNSTALRLVGYRETMMAHGLTEGISVFDGSHFLGERNDEEVAHRILKSERHPTAVFCWTDTVAFTLMAEALKLGIRIPEDLSVVGYDNARIAALPQISLTSIDQSGHMLGSEAMKLLIERIEGRRTDRHIILPPRLDAKGSTAQAPAQT
ncbi:LacI family DNA-binding transcriptional regulator [Pleomorphomonas sp. JP5]|uniref:LacI family DNA-binding transcriptional regulator n=1 Tax=Pleomorphomonas sp. JP5 TaxID=2942998 RepID=UPI002043D417|nr:LacI family DNA-binding transcriptional regulator [Pleomorphomonas sp. JP5]MCM5558799.1 LacI family transcriptional regulator [Pleomorphomonas sp. JP5]